MKNKIFKNTAYLLMLMGVMTVSSCNDKEDAPVICPEAPTMSVAIKGLANSSSGTDTLSVFQFNEKHLIYKTVFDKYDPAKIDLVKDATQALYCVSGLTIDAPEMIPEAEFRVTKVESPVGANTAPYFMSAYTTIEAEQKTCELTLTRGVARIDLDARDADMEISYITVENAPATSYIFAGQELKSDQPTTTYRYDFTTAPTGVENGLFMVFESAEDVNITIHGKSNGKEIAIPAVIPSVERNKVYKLRVFNKNSTVKASVSIADWEDGGIVNGSPDTTKGLLIDEANSVFPEGVVVDYATNTVYVTDKGVKEMKIAFTSELRVDLDTVYFEGKRVSVDSVETKYVRIDAEKPQNTMTGVVTKFDVNIEPQLKGRPEYEIKMYVKKMMMATSYDYVTIHVAPSSYQIPTVEIGGLTWMAFNATSPDIDDQIYLEDGKSVEDMYVSDWVRCTGGLFQFGRQYMYIPYQSYNPANDRGGQKQDIPWIHATHMPCPEGFHVPSLKEINSLFPNNTVIPSTYKAGNGETISVEIVRLPGDVVTPTNVNGVCRYVKFTSAETGNCLILPLGGYKGDKSTAASSNFGRDVVIWSNENPGCPGGYARAYRFMFNWGNSCTIQDFQWQMEAFAYVRAVKD